jgi:glycosyltransferase involved in cell wall biosynthesis
MQDQPRKPLVSVAIPCYNADRWLRDSIDSCLKQTYRPLEIIVVDDGLTDKSLQILRSYGSKIKYKTGPSRGGNHARNRGFTLSGSECVQFFDADDYLLREKLERQVTFL